MASNTLQSLFTYNNVQECENTLNLAYAIREVITSAQFKEDARVRAGIVLKNLNKEIDATEAYWSANNQ